MVYGYAGKLLRINLTTRSITTEMIDYDAARLFIGGRGYCSWLLFNELPPGIDPLSPDNKVIYGVGPLTGAPVIGSAKYVIVTKSPQTGLFLDTYAGGSFGPELKFAGYDFVIIEGKAEQPVYILIRDDSTEIRDASHLWGLSTWEAETRIKKELGDETVRLSVIGPAGERLSNLALVQSDYYHQCGRGGAGAVLGSKNVKGLAVRGSQGVSVARPQAVLDLLSDTIKALNNKKPAVERMKYGTPLTLNFTNNFGILPTYNFREGQFQGASGIDAYAVRDKTIADGSCYSCPMGCTKLTQSGLKTLAISLAGGPEYEATSLLGSNLGIDSIDKIICLNSLCDSLGLDVIGAGNVVAWAMECYERGIINKEYSSGLDLRFGNYEAAAKLIEMMAYREGIGDLLTQGVRRAAQVIGQGSEEFAMHVKGLEYPGYRPGPRSPGFGLVYAITERGGCHRRAWPVIEEQNLEPFTTEGRAQMVKRLYDQRIPWHCAVTCDLPILNLDPDHDLAAEVISAVTGWEFSWKDMQDLCDRVASLLRVFNIREGVRREDDSLAARSFEPDNSGAGIGRTLTKQMLDEMLDEYYSLRGWDKDGFPTDETLLRLCLNKVANEVGKYRSSPGEE